MPPHMRSGGNRLGGCGRGGLRCTVQAITRVPLTASANTVPAPTSEPPSVCARP